MDVILLRHGESLANVKKIIDDDPKNSQPLTEKGKKDVEVAAIELKNKHIDTIYVSELTRAKQTAQIINNYHNSPVLIDQRLNEIRTGFTGQQYAEYEHFHNSAPNRWEAKLPGCESFEDVKRRAQAFLKDLFGKRHECALIVSHGDVILSMMLLLEGLSNEEAAGRYPKKGQPLHYTLTKDILTRKNPRTL